MKFNIALKLWSYIILHVLFLLYNVTLSNMSNMALQRQCSVDFNRMLFTTKKKRKKKMPVNYSLLFCLGWTWPHRREWTSWCYWLSCKYNIFLVLFCQMLFELTTVFSIKAFFLYQSTQRLIWADYINVYHKYY